MASPVWLVARDGALFLPHCKQLLMATKFASDFLQLGLNRCSLTILILKGGAITPHKVDLNSIGASDKTKDRKFRRDA